MLDNASEIIEENLESNTVLDDSKIKEKVFQKIHKPYSNKIKWWKKKYIAVLAAVLSISGITVWAHEIFYGAGKIDENRDEIMEYQNSQVTGEDDLEAVPEQNLETMTELINPENLYENDIPIAKYIIELPVDVGNKIPESYLDNGAMIIFTPIDADGWDMDGESTLKFEFHQARTEGVDESGTLEVGYICSGKLRKEMTIQSQDNNIDFHFSDKGVYAVYLKNLSSDRIIISGGVIEKEGRK